MLDQMHDSLESLEILEALPSNVVLPEGWLADTDRPVPLATCLDDMRHFTRYKYRTRALLSISTSLPAVARPASRSVVFTKDVSREGIAFYTETQLFPRERMRIWLPGQ
ncbi:MAG: hypothetical protein JNM18_15850, partial [Planctomycetaceae bacterium]|nr:hypothetical protein [Planctomycetaceae bacterium]